jgi:hypothetical protein
VNTVKNLWVPKKKQDIFWQDEWLLAFQIISCTTEWVSEWVSEYPFHCHNLGLCIHIK